MPYQRKGVGVGEMTAAQSGCVADGPKLLGAGVAALVMPGWLKLLPLAYAAVVLSGRTNQSAQPGCAEMLGLKGVGNG